jgi:hypothetical protein
MNLAHLVSIESGGTGAVEAPAANRGKRKPRFVLTVTRRVRHWSDGAIIGSKLFVCNMTAEFYDDERAERKRFDESAAGLVSFRQLRERHLTCP